MRKQLKKEQEKIQERNTHESTEPPESPQINQSKDLLEVISYLILHYLLVKY